MIQLGPQYEIHLHGDIPLRHDVVLEQVEQALSPLWRFCDANSFDECAKSFYIDEPGLVYHREEHLLSMCWTVQGDDSFDESIQELCQGLSLLAREGAPVEVSYVDLDDDESVDEYHLFFVGPTQTSIIRAQRDLLIKETMDLMERHFEATQLGGVVAEIDRLFEEREKESKAEAQPKTLWTGIPFSGLCEPSKKRLH